MKRTTIFLPDQLHEQLRRESFSLRISMAELIRSRLGRPATRIAANTDPLAAVEGIVRDGRLSQDLDADLYA